MNKLLFVVAIAATITAIVCGIELSNMTRENNRLERNQQALLSDVETYRTRADEWAASTEVLELKVNELRKARSDDAKKIRELSIRLRDTESYAKSIAQHSSSTTLPLRDSIIVHDTVRIFHHDNSHTTIDGVIRNDSISYSSQSIDTIYQVVHRVPRRFLFFRFGTKAIYQDVWTSNPDTKIVYTEYIELEKRQKRRKRDKK